MNEWIQVNFLKFFKNCIHTINARNMENIQLNLKNAYLILPDMQIQDFGSIFAYRAQKIK